MNELEALGQLDNTYIIYTSDNGYHLGSFGMFAVSSLLGLCAALVRSYTHTHTPPVVPEPHPTMYTLRAAPFRVGQGVCGCSRHGAVGHLPTLPLPYLARSLPSRRARRGRIEEDILVPFNPS